MIDRYWNDHHGSKLDDYLDWYRNLKCLPFLTELDRNRAAIIFAVVGVCGKIHDHQHRVGKETLTEAAAVFLGHMNEIVVSKKFAELHAIIEKHAIKGFGVLAIYDTSLRLGAFLGLAPETVYLHAGAKTGFERLRPHLDTSMRVVDRMDLPPALQELRLDHVENFLCIFKDTFADLEKIPEPCVHDRGIC
jgi:hypothetical protein